MELPQAVRRPAANASQRREEKVEAAGMSRRLREKMEEATGVDMREARLQLGDEVGVRDRHPDIRAIEGHRVGPGRDGVGADERPRRRH